MGIATVIIVISVFVGYRIGFKVALRQCADNFLNDSHHDTFWIEAIYAAINRKEEEKLMRSGQ